MHIPNGTDTLIRIADPNGEEFQVAVDDETYAALLNEGWKLIEEIREVTRPPVDEAMFAANARYEEVMKRMNP